MSKIQIALTGGIACGKSSASKIFAKSGISIINLDVVAREVVKPKSQGLLELVSHFGNNILNDDNTLNRNMLRQQLLKDKTNQLAIEKILHPKILDKMQQNIKELNTELVVVEVPLLFEQNLWHMFDRIILIDCTPQNQLERLLKRENIDEKLAKKMISAQASPEQRLTLQEKLPTDIVRNNSDANTLEQQINKVIKKLLDL